MARDPTRAFCLNSPDNGRKRRCPVLAQFLRQLASYAAQAEKFLLAVDEPKNEKARHLARPGGAARGEGALASDAARGPGGR